MMQKTKEWTEINKELLEKIDKFRGSFTCKSNCWEWERWKYCSHLRNAIARKFSKQIEAQIILLAESSTNLIAVEPSQSLTIS